MIRRIARYFRDIYDCAEQIRDLERALSDMDRREVTATLEYEVTPK